VLVHDVFRNRPIGNTLGDGMVLDSISSGRGIVDNTVLDVVDCRPVLLLDGGDHTAVDVRHVCELDELIG